MFPCVHQLVFNCVCLLLSTEEVVCVPLDVLHGKQVSVIGLMSVKPQLLKHLAGLKPLESCFSPVVTFHITQNLWDPLLIVLEWLRNLRCDCT